MCRIVASALQRIILWSVLLRRCWRHGPRRLPRRTSRRSARCPAPRFVGGLAGGLANGLAGHGLAYLGPWSMPASLCEAIDVSIPAATSRNSRNSSEHTRLLTGCDVSSAPSCARFWFSSAWVARGVACSDADFGCGGRLGAYRCQYIDEMDAGARVVEVQGMHG
jgi:hypothetical protein